MTVETTPTEPTSEAVREAAATLDEAQGLDDRIRTVEVDGGAVTLQVDFDGLEPPDAEGLVEQLRSVVFEVPGVTGVRVEGAGPTVDRETVSLPGVDRVVAVASAKGGVGKTTVATGLARALAAEGASVGIFDADLYGPNVPTIFDVEGPVRAGDGGAQPVEADGIAVMSVGLLAGNSPVAWRGAMAHEALVELLADTAWGDLDTLVIDLPPGTGDVVLTTLQQVRVDGVVLVTTPAPTSRHDTDRSVRLIRDEGVPILGAVCNMAGFVCPTCGDEHALFGEDGWTGDAPLLAELPFDAGVRSGEPPASLRSLGDAVDARLAELDTDPPPEAFDVRTIPPAIRYEQVFAEFAALDPGEEMTVLTATNPDPLLDNLRQQGEGPAVTDHRIWRADPGTWVLGLVAGE